MVGGVGSLWQVFEGMGGVGMEVGMVRANLPLSSGFLSLLEILPPSPPFTTLLLPFPPLTRSFRSFLPSFFPSSLFCLLFKIALKEWKISVVADSKYRMAHLHIDVSACNCIIP